MAILAPIVLVEDLRLLWVVDALPLLKAHFETAKG